jgi:hypothetical protein
MITQRDEQIEKALSGRDVPTLLRIFFDGSASARKIRDGVCHESELWDYKEILPDPGRGIENDKAWSDLAAAVLGFYNNHGGILFFGVTNNFAVPGIRTRLDSKILNEKLRRYISDRIWVEFQRVFIASDQTCVGIVLVPPRVDRFERFIGPSSGIRYKFSQKQSAIRDGDSTIILSEADVATRTRQLALPTIDNPYEFDESYYRLLRPEFTRFVYRKIPCQELSKILKDPRTSVVALTGIGGAGKTALASWATRQAYEEKGFSFITSITAKDRALTTGGIIPLAPQLSNYESLLDSILTVLGWSDYTAASTAEKSETVRELIKDSNGLLFVDNLETVDDARIIDFLESLPIGVKAITTSRTPRVRKFVYSIDPGPLTAEEIKDFVHSYADLKPWAKALTASQALEIGSAADGVPLAIEWIIKRATSPGEAIKIAEGLQSSGNKKDELLEFCFRRVFDQMSEPERTTLRTLAAVTAPLGLEPVIAATRMGAQAPDILDKLREDSLIQRVFDEESGTYRFTLLPLVRSFVARDTAQKPESDRVIRKRLTDWFEASDVKDASLRIAERQQRQGMQTSDVMLLDLAREAEDSSNFDSAKTLYERAYKTGKNWRAAHRIAEIYRHQDRNILEALRWYERCAVFAPKNGDDRGLIFREWGNVLKQSGEPDAIDLAISKFEESLRHWPDKFAAHSLATLYSRKGSHRKVVELRPVIWDNAEPDTREVSRELLVNSYRALGEILHAEKIALEPIDRRNDGRRNR